MNVAAETIADHKPGLLDSFAKWFLTPPGKAFIFVILGSLVWGTIQQVIMGDLSMSDWLRNWIELSIAGVTMGFLLFLMASGMTLVFGLMGIFNLAHGAFIAVGAYIGYSVIIWINTLTQVSKMVEIIPGLKASATLRVIEQGWFYNESLTTTVLTLVAGILAAAVFAGIAGYFFERIMIKPVYGNPLNQILVTMGGGIIILELLLAGFHGETPAFPRPEFISGMVFFGQSVFDDGIGVEKLRILAGVMGLVVFLVVNAILNRTKIGLLIRAGVESQEMVEVHGYRIKLLFIAVFVAALALAASGGVIWALYEEVVHVHMADSILIMVIVAIIVGGMGSVKGCLYGSLLITLVANFSSTLFPMVAGEASTVLLMIVVLMWRPEGLNPITSH